ncbi:MAG: lysine exporter LysO family protein [Eubacteriales bacterium]|nr:lysine exporter LysO family protein [Eubacteriales bacterium]
MIIGYIVANRFAARGIFLGWIQKAMMITVYVLCFVMGLRMGINEQVTSNLGSLGAKAFIITVFCVAGSMVAIFAVRKILGMDRYGDIRKSGDSEISGLSSEDKESSLDIKSTVIIISVVAIGLVLGALVLAKKYQAIMPEFESVSATSLTVLLCILLFFVGFDLGASGEILLNLKKVGFKAIAFPVAAVIGTLVAGTAACMIMGFSLKEGTAISMGFGWYTYAPVVIAGAGQQYMIASAVSFMHNVIRETAGIILIPILAKKTGYLEVTGIPGVAAMDICMPIVERSCRSDTVIYSFATGLLMCIVTSVCTPLIMSL